MASRNQRSSRGQSGQAAVEAALTLPLTVFLVLGTIQLFMMLQGRIMAEYAAFEAVRAGSRHHGDCEKMMHAGLAALLPNVVTYLGSGTSGGSPAEKLASAWRERINGGNPRFVAMDSTQSTLGGSSLAGESIFWLAREQPTNVPDPEDRNFDAPVDGGGGMRLEVRLIYWFPLRIPFADWVMTRMFMAHFGLQDYNAVNPLMPAQRNAGWTAGNSAPTLDSQIRSKYQSMASAQKYVFPIQATYGMRMMTPAKSRFFQRQNCGETPEGL
ncbi:TadE/TadG family type IV pilus assembly protein [Hyalangium rubrum]|uniref:TadE family protein n=1 Tax=Hyalangium rubrum TaxID=3103134 RepID=A0ABU5GYC2_9BACT|nr:TadE family protein [Hyalangium sp. s54d21]MDY7226189.1 TadE family protein [Hyalangium sp. s54d21]